MTMWWQWRKERPLAADSAAIRRYRCQPGGLRLVALAS